MNSLMNFYQSLAAMPKGDMIWMLMILALAMVYGWMVGRDRALTILVSLYAALAVMTYVPLVSMINRWLNPSNGTFITLAIFLGIFMLVYFLLWNSEAFHCLPGGKPGYVEALGTGILHVGLLVCITLLLLPQEALKLAPVGIFVMFGGTWAKAFWFLAPLAFLYFSKDGYSSYYDEE